MHPASRDTTRKQGASTHNRVAGARPQALPLKQARAHQTRENLLRAGEVLLREGGFDDVSIAQIAQMAGCSVGTFYFSFRDKEAYFEFLLDSIMASVRERALRELAPEALPVLDGEGAVHHCVAHFVGILREYEGLVRAVTQYTAHNAAGWQPMRALGIWMMDTYTEIIVPRLPASRRETARRNMHMAFQIAMGYLVNAILHHPEDLRRSDLVYWLDETVRHGLRLAGPPQPAAASGS